MPLDNKGREIMDPMPAKLSVRRGRTQGLVDEVRRVVQQMHHEAERMEADSEADMRDFDIPDEEFPRSPHELFVETEEYGLLLDDIQRFAREKRSAGKPNAPEGRDQAADPAKPVPPSSDEPKAPKK